MKPCNERYKPKESATDTDVGTKWVPHVGDEVDVWVDNVGYWALVKVLAVDGRRIVWRNGSDGESYIGTDMEFVRPIQSERANLTTRKPMKSTDLLSQCAAVQSERGKQYDASQTGERSFQAAADAFNALTGQSLKGSDVCLMLVCVKAVRQYSDPSRVHDDSVLDLVSYASLWGEELYKEAGK